MTRLQDELVVAGLTISGLWLGPDQPATTGSHSWHQRAEGWVRVDWLATPTTQQQTTADGVVAAHDGSPAGDVPAFRASAVALLANPDQQNKALRAVLLSAIDAINTLRQWDAALKAAVAGATTLAALKTAIAALPDLGAITPAQARVAVMAKINAGDADL